MVCEPWQTEVSMSTTDTSGQRNDRISPHESRLNLGCGTDTRGGNAWRNADISESVPADDYFDMTTTPWPYETDSFEYVLAKHSLEHLEHDELVSVFEELGRVLRSGGRVEVRVPFGADDRTDTSHESTWDWLTPERFTERGDYSWETGQLPFELIEKDANAWVQPPPSLVSQLRWKGEWYWNWWRHGPGAG